MTTKITRDVLEGYLNCKTKGHLRLSSEHGTRSDYEAMLVAARDEVRWKGIEKVIARYSEDEVVRNILLTGPALKVGARLVLDAVLEDDFFRLQIDGLKRMDGPSKLGDFH